MPEDMSWLQNVPDINAELDMMELGHGVEEFTAVTLEEDCDEEEEAQGEEEEDDHQEALALLSEPEMTQEAIQGSELMCKHSIYFLYIIVFLLFGSKECSNRRNSGWAPISELEGSPSFNTRVC